MSKMLYKFITYLLCTLFIFSLSSLKAQSFDLTVAKDGSGNFSTVQAAIEAVPINLTAPYKIYIKKGVYFEKINVPTNKPFVQLIGESLQNVVLTYDDYSGKPNIGTSNSASVTINATDFFAANITFANSTGESPQALAINVNNDRIVFFNCRFLGGQDTVLCNGLTGLRQYFKNCYIDGTVDFIFGGASAIFEDCIIYPRDRSSAGSSYITAANTQEGTPYGFTFINCVIPPNKGATRYWLGRPWQNDGTNPRVSHSKTVFINAKMSNVILPAGWSVWTPSTITSVITYAESQTKNMDGSPYNVSQRVNWSKQLSAAEANEYTLSKIFGTWNPCQLNTLLCSPWQATIATSNYKVIKGTSNSPSKISWNASWAIKDVKYELLRADNKTAPYTTIYTTTSANDTTYNFDVQDTIPAPTQAFFYIVRGSKTGLSTFISDTLSVSSIPTITIVGNELRGFLQSIGTPSAIKVYSLVATDLLTDIKITIPLNFEISLDAGVTWKKGKVNIVPQNKTVTNINVLVRLNASSPGSYTGDITHESTSANIAKVNLYGNSQIAPLKISNPLLYYPFTTSLNDNISLRDVGVEPLPITFVNTSLSNGLANAGATALSPFTVTHGMAYGAGPTGLGLWTTASGGPGGEVNRNTYTEFKIVASKQRELSIDSLILNNTFFLSSLSTKLAIVYSLTNFRTDSTDIAGGIGSNGLPLISMTGTGSFNNPITIANDNAGNNANFRLSFQDYEGVKIKIGDTLTIRIYQSCGSGSQGRYAKIKDLYIKGNSTLNTGVKEEVKKLVLYHIFQNPVSNSILILHPQVEGISSFSIYNTLGRLMKSIKSHGLSESQIDINEMPSGNYYLEAKSGEINQIIKFVKL